MADRYPLRIAIVCFAAVAAMVAYGIVDEHRGNDVAKVIRSQLGVNVTDCRKTNATGKFTCDLDGEPHCYLFELSLEQAARLEAGDARYADFTVEDYGKPPSAYGC